LKQAIEKDLGVALLIAIDICFCPADEFSELFGA
jgi:hypothetical protein